MTNQNAQDKARKPMKNIRLSHKKDGVFGATLDLTAYLERTLSADDLAKAKEGEEAKSYTLATTGGFIGLTAPGFEHVQVSINVIVNRKKYDAMAVAERKASEPAPGPATSAPAANSDALLDIILQQQEMLQSMQAKLAELSEPKRRKTSAKA